MKAIDFIILLLFTPATALAAGYFIVTSRNICTPTGPFYCLGVNWIVDVVVVPLVIFSTSIGFFFLSRRLRTDRF
jgi:hypothetical protein